VAFATVLSTDFLGVGLFAFFAAGFAAVFFGVGRTGTVRREAVAREARENEGR
jgi:hypothetical protein